MSHHKKTKKNRRPVSRILYSDCSEPLPFIWSQFESGSALPTPLAPVLDETARAAHSPSFALRAMAGKQGVHGISTRKVCPSR